jgi:hypothetical protein
MGKYKIALSDRAKDHLLEWKIMAINEPSRLGDLISNLNIHSSFHTIGVIRFNP